MRLIKLWLQFVKFSISRMAVYRVDFLFRLFSMVLMTAIMYVILSLPYKYVGAIAGWDKGQAMLLMGVYYMSNGLAWTFFREGISQLERKINSGTLDRILMKPVSTAFLISFFKVDVSRIADFAVGLVFMVSTIVAYDLEVSFFSFVGGTLATVAGLVFVFALFLAINSLAFWTTETYLDHVANPLLMIAKYPVDIWGENFKLLLYWIIPVGVVSTIPTAIIIGKMEFWWCIVAGAIAGLWVWIARLVWRYAIKHYSSVGS